MGPFLPTDWPGPGGLKGRGTLDEPGRREHHREQCDRGAQRVPGVESAEGFLDSSTPYLNTTRETACIERLLSNGHKSIFT